MLTREKPELKAVFVISCLTLGYSDIRHWE